MTKTMHTCERCLETGKHGAEFVLCVGTREFRVHKYCGNLLAQEAEASAPKGVTVRVVHWAKLREEKRSAQAEAESAKTKAFWAERFAQAEARKKPPAPALIAAE